MKKNILANISTYYFFVLIALFSFAAILRFYIPPIPFTGPDSIGYLGVPFRLFELNLFEAIAGRSIVYPAFLTLILITFKSVNYIPVIQHLIGILAGVLLLISWNKLYCLFFSDEGNPLKKVFYHSLGVFTVSLYLLSYYPIDMEHWTHPESITAFMFMFLFYSYLKIIEMLKSKEVETRLFKVYFFINLFFVFNFVIFIYQPRWGFGLFLCLFVLFILISSVPSKWYKKIVFLVVLPLSICFLAVYIPNERYIQYDIYSKTNGLKTIFSSNQNFICLEIEKDINDPAFQKYDKKFLRAIIEQYHLAKDKELVKPYGIQWYPTLGYNLDYLLFGPREKILESYFGRDDKKYNGFFRYYILRSIVKHPVMFFSKVFKELSLFYFDGEKYPLIRPALIDNWHYSETILEFFKTLFTTKMFLDYYNNIKYIQKFKIDMSFYPITLPNLFLQFYSIVYSWVLVLFLLALIVSYFLKRKKLFHFGLNGLFLYLITFFILLTLAASHTVNARYIADLFILILFGGSFGISYVVLSLWNFFSYFFRNGS